MPAVTRERQAVEILLGLALQAGDRSVKALIGLAMPGPPIRSWSRVCWNRHIPHGMRILQRLRE
jgi:hypothetical protein